MMVVPDGKKGGLPRVETGILEAQRDSDLSVSRAPCLKGGKRPGPGERL